VRVTSPLRTLLDCAAASVSPGLVAQAQRQAVKRGLVLSSDCATRSLAPLGLSRDGGP
jgi:hypothetical protein